MARYKPWIDDGKPVTVRPAGAGDEVALERLAVLDEARPLSGAILLAVVDGEIRAALSLADGRVLADPFRATRHARELLSLRSRHLAAAASGPRRPRLHLGLTRPRRA